MKESRTVMLARLKAMRKKYRLGEFKSTSSRSSAPRRKRRSVQPMARRKRKGRASRSSGGAGIQIMDVGLAAGYGYFREDVKGLVSPFVAPVAGSIPPEYADAIVLGGGAYMLNKFNIGGPMGKKATKAIVLAEAYEVGKQAR